MFLAKQASKRMMGVEKGRSPEKDNKNDRKNLTVSRYPFKLNIEPILVCINRNIEVIGYY